MLPGFIINRYENAISSPPPPPPHLRKKKKKRNMISRVSELKNTFLFVFYDH